MRRMIVLTVAGGAIAAYFAYPYGLLTAFLAYFVGGFLCAGIGILTYIGPWVEENEDQPKAECERQEKKAAPEEDPPIRSEFSDRADTVS